MNEEKVPEKNKFLWYLKKIKNQQFKLSTIQKPDIEINIRLFH